MALLELAENTRDSDGAPCVMSLATLAARQQLTVPYLEQLFNKLKRHKLVNSVRGPSGGYCLARPAAQISIAEVMMAAGETFTTTRCIAATPQGCMGTSSKCKTHQLWIELGNAIQGYLTRVTLADVLAGRVHLEGSQ